MNFCSGTYTYQIIIIYKRHLNKLLMKPLTIFILALQILYFTGTCKAETIRFVTTTDYCPFACNPETENGLEGFMVEIARYSLEKKGHKIKVFFLESYQRSVAYVREGKYDGNMVIGKESAPELIYPVVSTGPHRIAFIVKKEFPWKYTGIESLKNIMVGGVIGYGYADEKIDKYLVTHKTPAVQLMGGQDTVNRNLQKLFAGRIDTYLEGEFAIQYLLSRQGKLNKIDIAGYTSPGIFYNYTGFYPGNKNAKKYAMLIDDGYYELRITGKLKKILKKYGLKSW